MAPAARSAALGDLTRDTLHTVGNDLFVVLAQLELLREQGGAEAAELSRVEASGAELKRRLARLSTLARGDAGGHETLVDAVRGTAELLQALGRVAELEMRLEEGVVVEVPSHDLAQILLHVLLRATAGGRKEPLAVEVRLEGGSAVVAARGSGAGATPRDGGLGTAVAGALARLHGGSLDIAADGSVRLSLPRV